MNLWDISNEPVEDDGIFYDSWNEFIENRYKYRSGCWDGYPVFWTWFKQDKKYAEEVLGLGEDETIDDYGGYYEQLILIYLSTAPTRANVVRINVKPEDQETVKNWLICQNFPMVIPQCVI
jgi:hypothetical protein